MKFELLPTLHLMTEIYQMPAGKDRFDRYLQFIKGDSKDDMQLPLADYNPMAKEHITVKMNELKKLDAEKIIRETLDDLNQKKILPTENSILRVALNLADDLKGGWTNRYTSDYDSKFKINAFVERNFSAVIFRTGEDYTEDLIRERTLEYVFRYIHWFMHPKPITLEEHVNQEKFVAFNRGKKEIPATIDYAFLDQYYHKELNSESYSLIFNFLYGDEACEKLAFPTFGIKGEMAGFHYANR